MAKLGKGRFRSVGVVVAAGLALLGSVLVSAARAADSVRVVDGVSGCDTSRTGVSYGPHSTKSQPTPGVVPCVTYNFPQYGEGGIVVTPPITLANGIAVPSAVMQSGAWPPKNSVLTDWGVARSVDGGAHWGFDQLVGDTLEPVGNSGGSDPGLIRDPYTGRVFEWSDGQLGFGAGPTGNINISYSDDNGETWVSNPGPDMQFTMEAKFPVWDAIIMFTGPPGPDATADKAALSKASYPDVVYLCSGGKCFKSLDGGINFSEITDSSGTDEAGANSALVGGPTGILYGAPSGANTLSVSNDDGATWTTTGQGTFNITRDCTRAGESAALEVDHQGDLYLGGMINNRLAITYSRDGGGTWSRPTPLQMPEVAGVSNGNGGATGTLCAFAADWNRSGHMAASYYGYLAGAPASSVTGVPGAGGPQHAYITETSNIFAANPVFTAIQADSNADSLMPNGPPCSFPPLSGACVPHGFSRMDYIRVTIAPDGSPWALFFKDVCDAPACYNQANPSDPVGSVSNASGGYHWSSWQGAVVTMVNSNT